MYTPESEKLEPVVAALSKAIDDFNNVVDARVKSDSYIDNHKRELHELRKRLLDLQMDLMKLS
jgi:cell shape-determining protein MreC